MYIDNSLHRNSKAAIDSTDLFPDIPPAWGKGTTLIAETPTVAR
jgi:hypothetical protein